MSNTTSYFLIGGSGFLGKAFSNFLKTQHISSTSIIRGEISNSKSLNFREEMLRSLPISAEKNIIIDFAYTSVPGTSFFDPVKDFSENLYNVNSHLLFASRVPNAVYVYVSSGGTVYGNVSHEIPISETAENFPLSPYGITKLACEKYSFMYKTVYGIDVKIVRAANIYGPGQIPFRGQGFIATSIASRMLGKPIQIFGDGSAIRDYLYVDDFCNALYSVMNRGTNGAIYNIGSQVGYSTNNVLEIIDSTLAEIDRTKIEFLPCRPFDVTYNVLNCEKIKSINDSFYQVELGAGVSKSYKWISEHLNSFI